MYLANRGYEVHVDPAMTDDINKAILAESFGFTWEYVESLNCHQEDVYLAYLDGVHRAQEANNASG